MHIIGIDTRLDITGRQYPWRLVHRSGDVQETYRIALPADKTWLNEPFDPLYGDLLEGDTVQRVAQVICGKIDNEPVTIVSRHIDSPLLSGLNLRPVDCRIKSSDAPYEADAEIQAIMRLHTKQEA